MIIAYNRPGDGETDVAEYDTNACEIIDGALVIHDDSHPDGLQVLAGFAPGVWKTFSLTDENGGQLQP